MHAAAGERARIEKAGGYVSDGRLNGRMQVSRSFGDAALKKVRAGDEGFKFKLGNAETDMLRSPRNMHVQGGVEMGDVDVCA